MSRKLAGVAPRALTAGALVLFASWAAPAGAGERSGRGQGSAGGAVPVTAATVEKKAMPVEISTFGAVEANATVTIKPQVTGVITKVCFKEGQAVIKGGDLFAIDARPFEADLERARAQLKNAKEEFDRQTELNAAGGTTKSAYQQAEANLTAAEASAKLAALNVEYCAIKSPIDGRAGAYLMDAGNMVKSGDTALAVINQVRPIQVGFSVPQQSLAEIKGRMAEGRLKVSAFIPGQDVPETGELAFVDNAVDRTTGTVRLKAVFENAVERLWPGQFVSVKLVLRVEPDAIVVPSKALQNGQRGLFLFVIEGEGTNENPLVADKREPVTVDREIGDESVISSKNLQPGERVVTDGQLRIVPKPKDSSPKTAGGALKINWSTLVIKAAGQEDDAGRKKDGAGGKDGTQDAPDRKAGGAPLP